jgi:signal transduction histidine kinase
MKHAHTITQWTPARQWQGLVGILLILGGFIAWGLYAEYVATEDLERERLITQTKVVDENLAYQLTATHHALNSIRADLPLLMAKKDDLTPLRHRLQIMRSAMPTTRAVTIFDAQGTLIARSPDQFVGQNFSQRDYFQVARQGGDAATLYVAPPFLAATGDYVLNVSKVLLNEGGGFAGVILVSLGPEYFSTLLKSVLFAADMRSGLVHADGKVIFRVPDPEKIIGADLLAQRDAFFTQHLASGQPSSVFEGVMNTTGEARMSVLRTIRPAAVPMNRPLVVVVSRDLTALFASWRTDLLVLGGMYALLVLASTLSLHSWARRRKEYDALVAEQEVRRQQAAQALRQQAEALERSNADLTRLGEVMAHHFQEPTRRLSSFAQRLLAKSDLASDEDSRLSLHFIDAESKRLSNLVRDAQCYLALDHRQVSGAEVADSAAALRQCIEAAGSAAAEVIIVLHEPLPRVRLAQKTLGELFAILLDNALRYRDPQRALRIEVRANTEDKRAVFRFADNGSGIAPLYRVQALGLFTRLVPSSIPGTGMGLALANKIVGLVDGELHIEDGLGAGAAEGYAQVKEESARRAGDTEQNALPTRPQEGGICVVFDLPLEVAA